MPISLRRPGARIAKGREGFTLIEMIVVVGLILVLAAVIVPNIGKFIGAGEAGARGLEWGSVQLAGNAMLAEAAVTQTRDALPVGIAADHDAPTIFDSVPSVRKATQLPSPSKVAP